MSESRPTTADSAANARGWERLPTSAVVAMYIRGAQKAVRENLFLFIGGGTGALVSDAFGLREITLIAGGLLLIGLLVTLVYHRRFRFQIADDAIRVRKGLFEIKELKVRFERVQNVAFSQPLYLRPLGLIRVHLETPGASRTEVELPGIPVDEALDLREIVAGAHRAAPIAVRTEGGAVEDAADPVSRSLFAPGFGDLFCYGLTSNQLWIVLGLIGGPLAERIGDRVEVGAKALEGSGLVGEGSLASAPLLAAGLVLALVAAIVAAGLLLSGLIAVIRFHSFRLTGDAERLDAVYGLLDKREKSLKRTKLHSLELVQTAFGRALGRWHAVAHQAALDALNPVNRDQRFLVPGISNARLDEVASALAGHAWSMPEFQTIDRRFRRVIWQRAIGMPYLITMLLCLVWPHPPVFTPYVLTLLAALGLLLVHLRWKRWGVHLGDNGLQVRRGLIGTTIVLFEDARCQQVRIETSRYQRRHGLATLVLQLPHGEITLPYLPEPLAAAIANRLLLRIETSRSHAL